MTPWLVAAACGAVAGAPVMRRARRCRVLARASMLRSGVTVPAPERRTRTPWLWTRLLLGPSGRVVRALLERRRRRREEHALTAELPVTPRLQPLTDALLASDRLGAPVGDALARLAVEERAGLRRRAEAEARTVPVRLLFPLVFLVLPAFGLLTVVPTLVSSFGRT